MKHIIDTDNKSSIVRLAQKTKIADWLEMQNIEVKVELEKFRQAIIDDLIANSPQSDDVRKDAERMVMLFAPDIKCDMSCMYACTEGFTKRADCIDKARE